DEGSRGTQECDPASNAIPGPAAHNDPRSLGSSKSLIPSPSRLKASTVMVIASPGNSTSHQGGTRPELRASDSMFPQVGVGGGMPTPRNPREASMMMATPKWVVARIR